MGTPSIFWTLSMADFHWPDIHDLFSINEDDSNDFRQNIIDNPHIVDWLFTDRVKSFVKYWLYENLNAEWHWYRFEFAVKRGSIHCHGLAKLKDDPGICDLTGKALKGFLAQKTIEQNHDIDNSELVDLQNNIQNGKEAERQICKYVDSLMTAMNPIDGPIDEFVRPNVHPCKLWLQEIPDEELQSDYINLANCVQRHTRCSSAYCLRKTNDGKQECRFKFSVQLQAWRENCDIQIILDHNACLNYIAKYASKAEKISDVAKEAFISVMKNASGQESAGNIFRKLIISSVGERDFSAQEIMHQILSLKLYCSSFDVVNCSLEGSRQISINDDEIETKASYLDDYANRSNNDTSLEIRESNLINFISNWFKKQRSKISKKEKESCCENFS